MSQVAIAIPEKLFFKIGEVCELAGVQAHVLRYWETEFPMLAPQKNRSGQRTYRRRDVEMALRIKQLLYDEQYTIAGAKKKLANDSRGASREVEALPTPKHPSSLANGAQPCNTSRDSYARFLICLPTATLSLSRLALSGADRVESAFGHKHMKGFGSSIRNEEAKFCAEELFIRPK